MFPEPPAAFFRFFCLEISHVPSLIPLFCIGPGNQPHNFRFVRMDEPLDEAILFLEVSGAHGVPAVPAMYSGQDEMQHFGYSDLVNFIIRLAGEESLTVPEAHKTWTRHALCAGKTVADVLRHPTEPLAVVSDKASLLDVCKLLVEKHAHRAFVTEGSVLVNVISPSMIADFLLKHKSEIDQVHHKSIPRFFFFANLFFFFFFFVSKHQLSESIEKIGLARHRPIFSVNESSNLFDAFRYMVGERVTGCAVMRGDKIVGTVTTSDVRLVFEHGGAVLGKTCGEIVLIERKEKHAPGRVATITHDHTLLNLLESMVEKHVQRVWLIERDGKPCGTITYSDLIRVIVKEGYTDPSLLWGN